MAESTTRRPGVVILGAPRSGTTLLRRILDAHPNIAAPPETYALAGAARFLREDRFAAGLRIGPVLGLGYAGFDEADVLARLRRFVFAFLDDHARAQGKPRWAEKTAFNAFHVDAIRQLCAGHVRFLCIQRHGLDVVLSLDDLVQKTGGYVRELHEYVRRYPQPHEAYARAWIECAEAIDALARESPHALDIRYEALVRSPEEVVRRVLDFLDEPWDDELIPRALADAGRVGFGDWKTYARAAVDASSVGRYRALPRPQLTYLANICNPTLQRLGYEPVATHAATGAAGEDVDAEADARRRYELGLLLNRMRAEKRASPSPAPDDDGDRGDA